MAELVNPRSQVDVLRSLRDAHEWLEYGIEKGFCSDVYCDMHDGMRVMSQSEADELGEGYDPCLFAVRVLWEGE